MKLLLCNKSYPEAQFVLEKMIPGLEVISCNPDEVASYIEGVDIVLPSVASIDSKIIASGNFGLIQQLGVGVDSIDLEAASKAGVWVANVPGAGSGNAESVAELAVLLMLSLSRKIDEARANLKNGIFFKPGSMALLNKTVCIVGLGDIGKLLAARLKGFGMKLIAVRKHPENGAPSELGVERVYGENELQESFANADFVVLAVPETKSTHKLINKESIKYMKAGAYLVNVARGGVIDTEALYEALKSGHLAGAGLDVFESEPTDPSHPIFKENLIATPHIGGNTDESLKGVVKAIAQNIQLYAQGKAPLHLLNKPERLRSRFVEFANKS